ncbi:MAG TPA: ATP-binding protein [Caldisericia bacterium]|nr:ATP-binding protein [Caldisericia bacterium]
MPNNKVRQGRIYTVFALLFIELLHIILIEKSLSTLLALLLIIYTIQVLITDNFINSQKNRNIFFILDTIFIVLIAFLDIEIISSLLVFIIPLSIMNATDNKQVSATIILILTVFIAFFLLNLIKDSQLLIIYVLSVILALIISVRSVNITNKTIPETKGEKINKLDDDLNIIKNQLNLIKELRDLFYTSSNIQEALSLFFDKLKDAFSAKACSMRLLESTGVLSNIMAQSGLSKDYVYKGEIDLNRSELNREVLLGQIIQVSDISSSPLIQYTKELTKEGIKSIIGVPILAKGNETIGILKLYFNSPKEEIGEDVKELLLCISGEIGLLIQNDLALKKLKEVDREKFLFLTTTAHQLRSPVAGLQSLLEIINNGYVGEINPKQKELIQRGIKRTNYMLNLISDLVSLASSELQVKKEYGKVSLCELTSDIVDSLKERVFEKSIDFTFNRPKKELYVFGNEDDLRKAIENIIENAVKYTKENGVVSVIIGEKQDFATITVSDTGIGIPRESLSNLFHDFYRSPNAKEFAEHGTGLGLSIVKRIIQEHNGRIFLASELGKGTTIKIFLPKFKDTGLKAS